MITGGSSSQRLHERRQLRPVQVPGQLLESDRSRELPVRGVDVSSRGLGLLLKTPLAPGSYVWLVIDHRMIRLTVRHCTQVDGVYRCGFAASAGWEDLELLMAKMGHIQAQ